jgi:hypothetical protein
VIILDIGEILEKGVHESSVCDTGVYRFPNFHIFKHVPYIETGRHVKNNACAVEIKIKWIKRKQMTHENTYREDTSLKANFNI